MGPPPWISLKQPQSTGGLPGLEGCPCGIILALGNWCSWLGPHPVLGYIDLLTWGLSSGSKRTKIWKLGGPWWPHLRNHRGRSLLHMTDQSKLQDPSRFRGGKQTSSLARKRAESHYQEALKGRDLPNNHSQAEIDALLHQITRISGPSWLTMPPSLEWGPSSWVQECS